MAALELWIANRAAPLITNAAWPEEAWWMLMTADERKTLENIVAKYRDTTSAQLHAAMTLLLERGSPSIKTWLNHWRSEEADAANRNWIVTSRSVTQLGEVVSWSVAYGFVFVVLPSLFLSLICRGGVVLHFFELALVKRDGSTASRLRIFWRTLVPGTFLVIAMVLVRLSVWPWSYTSVQLLLVAISLAGGAWAVWKPNRGPQDWLAGTCLVPR